MNASCYSWNSQGVMIWGMMLVHFRDEQLRLLYIGEDHGRQDFAVEVNRAYRKVVGLIHAAKDERDLRSMKSLHFEKLTGTRIGQHSMRLNLKWRLIVELTTDRPKKIWIVEIVDYH
jgi:proteic killer suppression protein